MLDQAVWRRWGFKKNEIDVLSPIACELAQKFGCDRIPNLDRTLEISAATLKQKRYERYKEALDRKLDAFGSSIPHLYRQIQPAAFFREIWLYQYLRREGSADKKEAKYLPLKQALAALSPDGTRVERRVRAYLISALDKVSLLDGFLLPDLKIAWSKRQIDLIRKCAGPRTLTGAEHWQDKRKKYPSISPAMLRHLKREYSEDKTRYWTRAMKVLAKELHSKSSKRASRGRDARDIKPNKRDINSTAYYYLNFLFPQTFEKHLSRKKAAELVRARLLPPKSARPKKTAK